MKEVKSKKDVGDRSNRRDIQEYGGEIQRKKRRRWKGCTGIDNDKQEWRKEDRENKR